MESILSFLYLSAMFSPFVMLMVAVVAYLDHRQDKTKDKRRSLVLFLAGVLGVGIASGAIGIIVGIGAFCAIYQNAQCGLGGVFFAGPFGFSVGAGAYSYFWAKNGKSP